MEYKDDYQILGVPRNAEEKQTKQAYRRLARKHHPDKNPGYDASEEKLKEISEAYEVLGSSQNRAKYDQLGRNYHHLHQMDSSPADFDYGQRFGDGRSGDRVDVNLGDLFGGQSVGATGFSSFFDSIFGGDFSHSKHRHTRYQQQNRSVERRVQITLEEAFHGTTRIYQQNGERFTPRTPRGARRGTKIRLRGKGRVGPADRQGGQTCRHKGKGMPRLSDENLMGDLPATIQIHIPNRFMAVGQLLYQQLADWNESERD